MSGQWRFVLVAMERGVSTKTSKRRGTDARRLEWSIDALHGAWTRLHHTDREPWPDEPLIKRLAARHAGFGSWLQARESAAAVARALQEAWRMFHAGDFAKAIAAGADLGPLGAVVASKAAAVDTLYRKHTQPQILKILSTAAERGERAVRVLDDHANAHYTLALVLGRYSQRISILNALAEGLGGRIHRHLERAIELEPRHAEAHLALGLYHAEIVAKLGGLAASLTYGASRDGARDHFQRAVKLAPNSPIVLMEYAHGLLVLDGDAGEPRARDLYERAAACEPLDTMEALDVARARSHLA